MAQRSTDAALRRERERMVRQLQRRGIADPQVLAALRAVPRHRFVRHAETLYAYDDQALPLEEGQSISQPFVVARMSELLDLRPGDQVLEIGTGSGYQTAVLAQLVRRVYSIERHSALMQGAIRRLREIGVVNVEFRCGDGTFGWPEAAPFDGIVVTAGTPDIPSPLLSQLAHGGRLVAPVGGRDGQELVRIYRDEEGWLHSSRHGRVKFVPLLGQYGWPLPTRGRSPGRDGEKGSQCG